MRILGISALYDAAGDDWRTKQAFDHHSTWQYRSAIRRPTRYGYPIDLPWNRAAMEWARADVVHMALGFEAEALVRGRRKPVVVHHHGTRFRLNRDLLLRQQQQRKARALVSTLDLFLMAPSDVEWSPTPYDLDWLASLRRPLDDGILRIAHAPTNRGVKSTAAFLVAVERLAAEWPVKVILVEGKPWRECLALKASADIYFDQVTLGYGCNAVEAWGMGIPVIAGAAPATLAEIERRAGALPFVLADEGTILDALHALADPKARATWAATGLDFARRFHAEKVVVERLSAVFAAA